MKVGVGCLWAAALLLSSCGETKFAEQYASRMSEVLKSYRDQVDAKILAEQQSYVDLAKTYDQANAERVRNSVLVERNRRATATVDRLVREKAAAPNTRVAWISQIHGDIGAFAELDFEQSQASLSREVDAYKGFIAGLADLEQEQRNLDNLKDSLEALAKPKSVIARLRGAGEFGCEVNRNFQLLDLGQKITALSAKIQQETDEDKRKSLGKQKLDLESQKKNFTAPCSGS